MKVLIDNLSVFYSEKIRLIKNLSKREKVSEHPEAVKWALQLLYHDGKQWIEVCRIDNHIHDGGMGSHIHQHKKKGVIRKSLSFQEAEDEIIRIGKRILLHEFKEILEGEQK